MGVEEWILKGIGKIIYVKYKKSREKDLWRKSKKKLWVKMKVVLKVRKGINRRNK